MHRHWLYGMEDGEAQTRPSGLLTVFSKSVIYVSFLRMDEENSFLRMNSFFIYKTEYLLQIFLPLCEQLCFHHVILL